VQSERASTTSSVVLLLCCSLKDERIELEHYTLAARLFEQILQKLSDEKLIIPFESSRRKLGSCAGSAMRTGPLQGCLMLFDTIDSARAVQIIKDALTAAEIPGKFYELLTYEQRNPVLVPVWVPQGRTSMLKGKSPKFLKTLFDKIHSQEAGFLARRQ
jgi:hypothetical protein